MTYISQLILAACILKLTFYFLGVIYVSQQKIQADS